MFNADLPKALDVEPASDLKKKTCSKLGQKRYKTKDVELFFAIDNEKMNVVNQKMARQKIGIDLKKFIKGVAQRDLKKGDGSVVTLFNSIVEQNSDETSIPLYSFYQKNQDWMGYLLLTCLWNNLLKKMGYLMQQLSLMNMVWT